VRRHLIALPLFVVALALLPGCGDGSNGSKSSAACEATAAGALQQCIAEVGAATGACWFDGDAACREGDPQIDDALARLQQSVVNGCAGGQLHGLSVQANTARLRQACRAQADAIAWRTFGGPQGAVWAAAPGEARGCLQSAYDAVTTLFATAFEGINACLSRDDCDAGVLLRSRQPAIAQTVAVITQACPALAELIAVDPETYVERALEQVDCAAATAHPDPSPLALRCGPHNVDVQPPRGEWTQIVLDGDKWGTRCGDGSEYAFYLRPAPQGSPLDRVLVGLQGGGVCLFESDCKSRMASDPGLFNALDDVPVGGGIAADDPANPFADWTRVYLPYCNQDVFAGGGVTEVLGDLELPRYGAINLRAALRVVRDILWRELDAAGGDGYRPDRLLVLFGGFSAGAYGTLYNYHWVLDDLQWPRTAAFPDAGGALDNGGIGVRTLGFAKIPLWGAKPYLPPYCFSGDCAVGPDLYRALSPRLKQVPEQQMLILSNQKDNTQQRDAFFADEAQWIDTLRSAYCDTRELPGIQWYLTSDSLNSVHVVSIRDEFFYGTVAGERMADWLWRAMTDPDSITDRAEEGNFVADIPGSHPFPCPLPQ